MQFTRPRRPPADFDMAWVRERLAAHRAQELPLGEPLDARVAPRAPGGVLHSRAAVAAILREAAGGPEVLLIRRAERSGDPWSGHMAFPGGREESQDPSLLHTAMRETREEIGWALDEQAWPIGRLDDVPAIARGKPTGLSITPYVFEVSEDRPVRANEEVAEVFWAPVAPMMRGVGATQVPYRQGNLSLQLPGLQVQGRVVWGLTLGMLDRLFELISDPGAGTGY